MSDVQSRFAAMPPKQKASVVIFFIIGLFVIYEVIGLFRGSSSSPAPITPAPTAKMTPKPQAPTPNAAQNPMNKGPQQAMKTPGPAAPPQPAAPKETESPVLNKPEAIPAPPSAFLVQQDQAQNRYVSAINDLQMLKIQREIAETNQAIVTAKLATVTAEKSITDMLEPEMEPNFGKKMPAMSQQAPVAPAPALMPAANKEPYVVQSVSMEQDQWHAVLSYKGKLYDVAVGDVMPTDGSTVTAIDAKGVTLELGDMKQRVPATETDFSPAQSLLSGAPPGAGSKGPSSTSIFPGG